MIWASGLVAMTSRLQRGDRLFNSGLAHLQLSLYLLCLVTADRIRSMLLFRSPMRSVISIKDCNLDSVGYLDNRSLGSFPQTAVHHGRLPRYRDPGVFMNMSAEQQLRFAGVNKTP